MVDPCAEFAHGLGAVGDIELFENTLHVVFDGERADEQTVSYFVIADALGDEGEHLDFSRGQNAGCALGGRSGCLQLHEGIRRVFRKPSRSQPICAGAEVL